MELLTKSLLLAVEEGNVKEVSRLIDQGVDVNSSLVLGNGNTALHNSVLSSNEEITTVLLEAGADMNLENNLGFTPLNYSLHEHRLKVGEILMKAGGYIDMRNRNGECILHIAMKVNDVGAFKRLLSMTPNLNLTNKGGEQLFNTALKWAAQKSDITLIVNLLKGICKNTWYNLIIDDMPLIHFLFKYKNSPEKSPSEAVEFIQTFVKLGFDVDSKNEKEFTILHELLETNYHEEDLSVLRCLLENGADPNAMNYLHMTPTDILISSHKYCNVCCEKLKLLAEYKANLKGKSTLTNIPLFWAIFKGCSKIISLLIKRGVDVNYSNYQGLTAVYFACSRRSIKMVRLLLDYGAEIDWLEAFQRFIRSKSHFTDEDMSVHYRDLMFLIKHIDINAVDSNGKGFVSYLHHRIQFRLLVMKHIALLEALDHPINQAIYDKISENAFFIDMFLRCQKELALAKKTRVSESTWFTYFHLLTGTKCQLKNFAGILDTTMNKLEELENLFPIYGSDIKYKVRDGVERRRLFDRASDALSRQIPIFDADSLIIHETLDCIISKEDLVKIIDDQSDQSLLKKTGRKSEAETCFKG